MDNDQKRMLLAVALSASVLFLWQSFFAPPKPVQKTVVTKDISQESKVSNNNEKLDNKINQDLPDDLMEMEIKDYLLSSEKVNFKISSNLTIKNFENKDGKSVFENIVGKNESPFQILVKRENGFVPLAFSFSQEGNALRGISVDGQVDSLFQLDDMGRVVFSINSARNEYYRIVLNSNKGELDNRQVREFTFLGGQDVERFTVGDEDKFDGNVKWLGIDFNYHLFSIIFDKKQTAYLVSKDGKLTADIVSPTNTFEGKIIFSKKNYDTLTEMGDKLNLSVDFGIFGILAVPILRGIQFCYKYIPNYGVGIILLTILLRFLTFPLYLKSIVSMKKMQKVQPELTKLKEKYKDDPQRMQKETMELFKRAGANPLGGCLPMLLQMPIFFAFYQVLYNAVELVNAPFVGWITDLSIKDPLYILPVGMAIAMFAQQKLTPTTTADPTQQKVMLFMPLIFGFIMKDLPAGLVLYIFVSTLFGIIQQLLVYKFTD